MAGCKPRAVAEVCVVRTLSFGHALRLGRMGGCRWPIGLLRGRVW